MIWIIQDSIRRTNGGTFVITNNVEECLHVYHKELQDITLNTDPSKDIQPFDAVILDYKMSKIKSHCRNRIHLTSIPILKYRLLSTYIIASFMDCYY